MLKKRDIINEWPLFVCLCACYRSAGHNSRAVFTKLHIDVGSSAEKNWLNCGMYLPMDPDSGLFSKDFPLFQSTLRLRV